MTLSLEFDFYTQATHGVFSFSYGVDPNLKVSFCPIAASPKLTYKNLDF